MSSSTNGISTTRLIVTRLGRLVNSLRRLAIRLACPQVQIEHDDAVALAQELERGQGRGALLVRDEAAHPPEQARAGDERGAILGDLDRGGRVIELQHHATAP